MKNILIAIALLSFTIASCKSSRDIPADTQGVQQRGERATKKRGSNIQERFAKFDTNNDGQLSKTEVKGPLANDFDKIDTDGNGFISMKEMEKAPKPQRDPRGQGRN